MIARAGSMNVATQMWSASQDYRAGVRPSRGQRAAALAGVAVVHAVVLGGLLLARATDIPPAPAPAVMVTLISEAPTEPVASPAQPPPEPSPPTPSPPTPSPRMTASPRPTASPMIAAPAEEPVRPTPPAPSAQTPAASAAGPPSPAPVVTTAPNFTAAYLNNPGPQYPYASRRQREEGVVRLKVLVSPAGSPEQVQIDRSSGFPNLDAAALDVVKRRWRFVPARQGDRAVSAWVVVPMQFELKDR